MGANVSLAALRSRLARPLAWAADNELAGGAGSGREARRGRTMTTSRARATYNSSGSAYYVLAAVVALRAGLLVPALARPAQVQSGRAAH
jgi:hypothetical protein